ncbi:MAG: DUF4062 domain-containing protein, partial [Bacteroidales bacterium]|nr:DUF4062 domain-containing protein [Bacteroidales bacterium]
MFECIERKINIFISSEILGLEHFRKSLKFLLYETGIVKDIYVFEQTGASSNSCQNAYLNEIQKCDLFILIIKNSTGLSNQIKKEYDKALLYNKRILIFFYNDSDDTCDFKKQVQSDSTYFEKYAESNTLFDLEKLIYKSFVEDVIAIYTNNNFIEDNQTNDEFLKYRSFSVFHTDYLKELNDENGLFDFLKATKKEPNGNFIYDRLNDFFDVVLCSKKYDKESFSLLKSNINSKYPESLKEIFVSRIDAVELCFEGDQISSINKLKILYDKVKDDVSIPEWLKNDV